MSRWERIFIAVLAALSLLQGVTLHRYTREQSLLAVKLSEAESVITAQYKLLDLAEQVIEKQQRELKQKNLPMTEASL